MNNMKAYWKDASTYNARCRIQQLDCISSFSTTDPRISVLLVLLLAIACMQRGSKRKLLASQSS
jgi:hypothetical protein